MTKRWLWRAWTGQRAKICDCGVAYACCEEDARRIAWLCVSLQVARAVDEMQIEEIL